MCRMFSPASTEGDATTLTAMNPEEEHTALNGTSNEWNITLRVISSSGGSDDRV